jgi:hypothetical protein
VNGDGRNGGDGREGGDGRRDFSPLCLWAYLRALCLKALGNGSDGSLPLRKPWEWR